MDVDAKIICPDRAICDDVVLRGVYGDAVIITFEGAVLDEVIVGVPEMNVLVIVVSGDAIFDEVVRGIPKPYALTHVVPGDAVLDEVIT